MVDSICPNSYRQRLQFAGAQHVMVLCSTLSGFRSARNCRLPQQYAVSDGRSVSCTCCFWLHLQHQHCTASVPCSGPQALLQHMQCRTLIGCCPHVECMIMQLCQPPPPHTHCDAPRSEVALPGDNQPPIQMTTAHWARGRVLSCEMRPMGGSVGLKSAAALLAARV